jgi:hypothetical protein
MPMTAKLWTAANGIMLALFAFSAVLQFNDPDPLAWVLVYGTAAAVCSLEIVRRATVWEPLALAIVALFWAGWIGARVHNVPISSLFAEWEMKDLRVEEAREMYGLLIIAVWMIGIVVARVKRARSAASSSAAITAERPRRTSRQL